MPESITRKLQEELVCIVEEYAAEELVRNSNHVSRKFHVRMATKVTKYLLKVVSSKSLNAVVFAQDPYKNDYCSEVASAFSYAKSKVKPPLSVKVLSKALATQQKNQHLEEKFLNLIADNHFLAKYGILFLDMIPFPAMKSLLHSKDKVSLSKLQHLQFKYARKVALVLNKHFERINKNQKTAVEVFTFGQTAEKLLPNLYKTLSPKSKDVVCFFASHPAKARWTKKVWTCAREKLCLFRLSNLLLHFIDRT